ncbi:peptide transporter family 1 isoform X3 [Zootermopsis nevadensis]|uniref:peptide transporter family 1 isoform X3 n=1 Tax=Zootermopsis nevadensis TaxID=136037 RepID=UPI000B8EE7A3|nr:peptide transporter family 1 isoform X3 [Zootermopsis nevadensis]
MVTQKKKPKYPKSVFFIVSNEFCERFSYYGMRTILALYLRNILLYSDDDATVIYHVFAMFCYFFPLFGAMLADTLIGKFRTIFYISIVYAIGNVVISVASATGAIEVPARELSIVGLLLIAIGTGGIKPCVSAFGGDQFKLPQQEKQLQQFFSLFYFAINSGSLISTFLTPVLREDVKCFDQDTCYPLAFGIPAVLMIISVIIFVLGKRLYVIKKPEGNVLLSVSKCIWHALIRKGKLKKHDKREHWLDYADDKYDKTLINDTKATLRVLFLYLPLPFFWALFDQQGSRWTFQATRMNGELGDWTLKPDQMQVVNPLLILIFIPIFETALYPLLAKCNIKRPLQKLGIGGVLAAIAFVVSAIVEIQLQDTYAVLPQSGEAQLRIFNGFNCPVTVDVSEVDRVTIEPLSYWNAQTLSVDGNRVYNVEVHGDGCSDQFEFRGFVNVTENEGTSYFITGDSSNATIVSLETSSSPYDIIDKSKSGDPLLRILYGFADMQVNRTLRFEEVDDGTETKEFTLFHNTHTTETEEIPPTTYHVSLDGTNLEEQKLQLGGVYTLIIHESANEIRMSLLTITQPNTVHMLWLIPQYFIITMGEVMFSITGLEFSFTQAPVSMKSVLQAGWLLTVAFGNLIVVIIAEAKFFDSQAHEFFLFAGLMLVDMAIFSLMAMKYKYVEVPKAEDEDESKSGELALKETQFSKKNGIDNTSFKGDEQG